MSGAQIRASEVQKTIEPVRQPARELIRRQEPGPAQTVAPQDAYRRAQRNRNGLRSADLLALQRTVGNRQVQRMVASRVEDAAEEQQVERTEEESGRAVQTKLIVGAPSELTEQGTERVAGPVMTMPDVATQRPNRTGLPDGLKAGIESLSGMSLDNVNVHYNSARPAQLNALAYTQGSDIHVAPGQERHLPHEAWHVVQQAQGRVQPTMQMKDGVPVNDDEGLEHEADVMGAGAAQLYGDMHDARPDPGFSLTASGAVESAISDAGLTSVVQRAFRYKGKTYGEGGDGLINDLLLSIDKRFHTAIINLYFQPGDPVDCANEEALVEAARAAPERAQKPAATAKIVPEIVAPPQDDPPAAPVELLEFADVKQGIVFPDDTWIRLAIDMAKGNPKSNPTQVGEYDTLLCHETQKKGNRSIWYTLEDGKMCIYALAQHGRSNTEYECVSCTPGIPKNWRLLTKGERKTAENKKRAEERREEKEDKKK